MLEAFTYFIIVLFLYAVFDGVLSFIENKLSQRFAKDKKKGGGKDVDNAR